MSALLRACALMILAASSIVLQGCAQSLDAALFDLGAGASVELDDLSRRARLGDKSAQLELGIRFEEGCGVAADLARAEKLYRMAASDSIVATHVYLPPVGKQNRGRVIASGSASNGKGLAEARRRLLLLKVK